MAIITDQDIDDLAVGAAVLGTGGGGDRPCRRNGGRGGPAASDEVPSFGSHASSPPARRCGHSAYILRRC